MNERQQTIEGIYNFVDQHKDIITNELNKIPQGSLINYNKDHVFGIEYDWLKSKNLRIHNKLPGDDNSSQAHVYIRDNDTIIYINKSKIVMDIIIDTYMIEVREEKLKQLGI